MVKALFLLIPAMLLNAQSPIDSASWLNRGVREFKSANYSQAVEAFQKAVDADPSSATAHLYLGTAWMSRYIPGLESAENRDFAQNAEREFVQVTQLDPRNVVALKSLGNLYYLQSAPIQDPELKAAKLREAVSWYQKLVLVDPKDREAFYSQGVIAWSTSYPALTAARGSLGMRPEDPGPLSSAAERYRLLSVYGKTIEDGIANLNRALTIDPEYGDAMAYMNLLVREKADLTDTPEEYRRDIAHADEWVSKALQANKSQVRASNVGMGVVTAPPPPPPPPPPPGVASAPGVVRSDFGNIQAGIVGQPPLPAEAGKTLPSRIRMGANVQDAKLISRPEPVYPALALQARIQGVVRMDVVVDKTGRVSRVQLISGHPLLALSAVDAVKQYLYRPTFLNNEPVEVVTTVDVNFTLP